jgi:2-amino-4-hydroxy-6-hydroxymethyldihydropteridine diphosphokinase
MRYFVGLGSNIAPRVHLPLMLRALLRLAPTLYVGRVLETAPVAVAGDPFLNVPVALESALSPPELKLRLNAVEAGLGRDRADPASKVKSRTADLDILFWIDDCAAGVPPELLPDEPYMRPMLLELLAALDLDAGVGPGPLPPGVALSLDGLSVGEEPAALALLDGRLAASSLALAPRGPCRR